MFSIDCRVVTLPLTWRSKHVTQGLLLDAPVPTLALALALTLALSVVLELVLAPAVPLAISIISER